jgi:hypothetical protein
LFAVGTDSTTLRVNDTVWASLDDGKTFDKKLKLDTRGGYNTVQMVEGGQIGVVYVAAPPEETGITVGDCSINIALVDPALVLA